MSLPPLVCRVKTHTGKLVIQYREGEWNIRLCTVSGRIAVIKEQNRVDTGKIDEKGCMIREGGVELRFLEEV